MTERAGLLFRSEGLHLFNPWKSKAAEGTISTRSAGQPAHLPGTKSAVRGGGAVPVQRALTCAALLAGMATAVRVSPAQVIPARGTPPPIIFVHGNGDDSTRWIPTVWLFESNGYPADRLFAIRFHNPVARSDNTREEPARSSTDDEKEQLGRFVQSVLDKTHAAKVVLIGSSRGGLTMRNYVQNGEGGRTVLAEILCGTPNHGVNATDTNLNGEFNGRGTFLSALNRPGTDGNEVTPGIPTLTLRSDTLDKYAQPSTIAFGHPEQSSGGSYDSPALRGAENIVLRGLDHRELAFSDTAFAAMYRFLLGRAPRTLTIIGEKAPTLSGLVTGFEGGTATNDPLAGVHVRVSESRSAKASAAAYEAVTGTGGAWGPVRVRPDVGYTFDLERDGRHVMYFLAPLRRSTTLLNFRFVPAPASATADGAASLLITRPEGYFSRQRDPVRVAGVIAAEEPEGLPLRDAFTVTLPQGTAGIDVQLRGETVHAEPGDSPANRQSIVEFLR